MIGQVLKNRYHILKPLGKGGFGETYLATDRQNLNHSCVVKVLMPQTTDVAFRTIAENLFDREINTLAKLGSHGQIPYIMDHFVEDSYFYLVQEFIDGNVLSTEMGHENLWSEEKVIKFLQDILPTLQFIHESNVIHRDIKPSNIIRRAHDNKLVIIDFGAVKEITATTTAHSDKTTVTVAIGTPGYMPNEQLGGKPRFCSDIYAVGMVAIQGLTGCRPDTFPEDVKTAEILWHWAAPHCSPRLRAILDKMIRYDFRQRFPSAQAVLDAISISPSHKKLSVAKPVYQFNNTNNKKTIVVVSLIGAFLTGLSSFAFVVQSSFFRKENVAKLPPPPIEKRIIPKREAQKTIVKTSIPSPPPVTKEDGDNSKQLPIDPPSPQKTVIILQLPTEQSSKDEPLSLPIANETISPQQKTIEPEQPPIGVNADLPIVPPSPHISARLPRIKPEEEALLREALKLIRQNQPQSALEIVDRLLQNNPNLGAARFLKTKIDQELQQKEQSPGDRNTKTKVATTNSTRAYSFLKRSRR